MEQQTPATPAGSTPDTSDPGYQEWIASLDAIVPEIDPDTGDICQCFGCYQGDRCYYAEDEKVVTIVEMRRRLGQPAGLFDPSAHDYMYCGCRKCWRIRRANGQKRMPPPEWKASPDPWDAAT